MGGKVSVIWTDEISLDKIKSRMFSAVERDSLVGSQTNWVIPKVDMQFMNISSTPSCNVIWLAQSISGRLKSPRMNVVSLGADRK